MSTKKPSGWWNAAAFHQPLLSLSPTKNVNYTFSVPSLTGPGLAQGREGTARERQAQPGTSCAQM